HFEVPASAVADVAAVVPLSVRLERAREGDHERLVALLARVLPGSLDMRDQESVAEHGVRGAAAQLADELLAADPVSCIRFAVVEGSAGESDAGIVSWRSMPHGHGYVLQVGVAVEHRGRGLGGELV